MTKALKVHETDMVGVALEPLAAGETHLGVTLVDDIPKGHKFSLRSIAAGEAVLKYGHPIGQARLGIPTGGHIHSHNLSTALQSDEAYAYRPVADAPRALVDGAFRGYRRRDGRVGVRNEIWILNTVGCVNNTAMRLSQRFQAPAHVEGVHAFSHPFGCSQLGDDLNTTRKILSALAQHPNAGGVLIVGLGCENNQLDKLLEGLEAIDKDRLRAFNAQSVDDEEEQGLSALAELAEAMQGDERTTCSAGDLSIGVKCGGSDAFSGLTANPLVGQMTDRVTAAGGRSILTEIPEIFGAEQLLMNRAKDEAVFEQIVRLVRDFKDYFVQHNQPISENPSPGNIAGGITTLEEKSLGAVQKGGNAIVSEVLGYGQRAREKGLVLLEAPGNDAVSSTALTAAGATLILFTTGRGTPLGFPAPTIKISTNSQLAEKKSRWIDFNAGALLDGESMADVADRMWTYILDVASGELTQSERYGFREIAIWKHGVTL